MKVFLDMDGVVADFYTAIKKKFRFEGSINSYEIWKEMGITKQEFYDACTDDFFESLALTIDAERIVALLEATYGKWNIVFLTSPVGGKIKFLKKNFPFYYDNKRYLMGNCKAVVAHPKALLIDDNENNIKRFVEAGGSGILVPAEHNINKGLDPFVYICKQIARLHE